jgi:hypothetical protein
MDNKPAPGIRDLYPQLNEKELLEVEDTLDRYLVLVLRIFERLELERDQQKGRLTPDTDALGCAE